jgi:Meckel syndrome type 1 protein
VGWIEARARTIEEAKDRALDILRVEEAAAEFVVLQKARAGVFRRAGGGALVMARVRVAEAPQPEIAQRSERLAPEPVGAAVAATGAMAASPPPSAPATAPLPGIFPVAPAPATTASASRIIQPAPLATTSLHRVTPAPPAPATASVPRLVPIASAAIAPAAVPGIAPPAGQANVPHRAPVTVPAAAAAAVLAVAVAPGAVAGTVPPISPTRWPLAMAAVDQPPSALGPFLPAGGAVTRRPPTRPPANALPPCPTVREPVGGARAAARQLRFTRTAPCGRAGQLVGSSVDPGLWTD